MNAELLKDMQRKLGLKKVWDKYYISHDPNELYIEPLINKRMKERFLRARSPSPD